jgi:Ca2+-binding EF-hand superfamily protein
MAAQEEVARRARENTAALRRVFALIDTDGSGSLSVAKLSATMGADASALMVAADAPMGDALDFAQFEALVAPSEFFRQSRATFDVLDANHDGRLTRDEVEHWLLRQLPENKARSRAAELTAKWATHGGAYRGKAADEPVSFADFFLFVTQSARTLPVLHGRTIGELAGFKVNFGDVWGRYGTGLYETPGGSRPPAEGAAEATSSAAAISQTASSHGRATVLQHMAAGAVSHRQALSPFPLIPHTNLVSCCGAGRGDTCQDCDCAV